MDIIPHHELREREQAHTHRVLYAPAVLGRSHLGEVCHHLAVIGRSTLLRNESAQVTLVLLLEQFYQRHVHHGFLTRSMDVIDTRDALPRDMYGHEDYRCDMTHPLRVGMQRIGIVYPMQHAEGQEQLFATYLRQVAVRATQ